MALNGRCSCLLLHLSLYFQFILFISISCARSADVVSAPLFTWKTSLLSGEQVVVTLHPKAHALYTVNIHFKDRMCIDNKNEIVKPGSVSHDAVTEKYISEMIGPDELLIVIGGNTLVGRVPNYLGCGRYQANIFISQSGSFHIKIARSRYGFSAVNETFLDFPPIHYEYLVQEWVAIKVDEGTTTSSSSSTSSTTSSLSSEACSLPNDATRSAGQWVRSSNDDPNMFGLENANNLATLLPPVTVNEDRNIPLLKKFYNLSSTSSSSDKLCGMAVDLYKWQPSCGDAIDRDHAAVILSGKAIAIVGDSNMRVLTNSLLDWACYRGGVSRMRETHENTFNSSAPHCSGLKIVYYNDAFCGVVPDRDNDGHPYDLVLINCGQHPAAESRYPLLKYDELLHKLYAKMKEAIAAANDKRNDKSQKYTQFVWVESFPAPLSAAYWVAHHGDWRTVHRLYMFNNLATAIFSKLGSPIIRVFDNCLPLIETLCDSAHYTAPEALAPVYVQVLRLLTTPQMTTGDAAAASTSASTSAVAAAELASAMIYTSSLPLPLPLPSSSAAAENVTALEYARLKARNGITDDSTYTKLKALQVRLDETPISEDSSPMHCATDQSPITEFVKKTWNTDNLPVIVMKFCLELHSLGNHLGRYLDALSCASLSGLHFITIKRTVIDSLSLHHKVSHSAFVDKRSKHDNIPFFASLPSIFPADNATMSKTFDEGLIRQEKECKCRSWCWGAGDAAWRRRIPLIAMILRDAFYTHIKSFLTYSAGAVVETHTFSDEGLSKLSMNHSTVFDPSCDLILRSSDKAPTNETGTLSLPLFPDVAIHYRISDNFKTGLLPYASVSSRIPPTAKYVYIFSESPRRSKVYSNINHDDVVAILLGLMEHIRDNHNATTSSDLTIVLLRSEDMLVSMAKLAFTQTVICSSSTFCLFAGLSHARPAKPSGRVIHMPFQPSTPLGLPPATDVIRSDFPQLRVITDPLIHGFPVPSTRDWVDVFSGKKKWYVPR